jgi:hypothetical protein
VLAEFCALSMEMGNGRQAVSLSGAAMTDQRIVSCSRQSIDDGAPNEAGSAENDHAHRRILR